MCSGDVRVELAVSEGEGPYTWSIESSGCGLSLEPSAEARALLHGSVSSSGDCALSIDVIDSQGTRGRFADSLAIHEVPVLGLKELPAACPFEEYAVPLTAHGGDVTSRKFETRSVGWSIRDDTLRTSVSENTQRSVSITVSDSFCSAAPVPLELPLEASCPTWVAVPPALPDVAGDALPVPCANMPYEVRIELHPEPTAWEAVSLPAGLTITPSATNRGKLLVGGSAAWPAGETASLALRVTSASGRKYLRSYSLTPRDKCWFAYVGRDSGSWQLHLVDPELDARRSFGETGEEVLSMSLSPSGRFLAYVTRVSAKAELRLVDLNNLHEQALSFQGSVEQYVWSPNGTLLAVVSRDNGDLLGGLNVSGVAATPQGASGIAGFTYLAPQRVDIEGAPVWFGEHSLAWGAPLPGDPFFFTSYAHVEGDAISSAVELSTFSYDVSPTLLGFSTGFAANDGFLLDFIDTGATPEAALCPHGDNPSSAFAPNGQYVANTLAGQLRWFAPAALEFQDAPLAESEANQCGALLAWNEAGNRTACATGSDRGALRFLARDAGLPTTLSTTTNTTGYVYSEQASNERRRVFARDGRSFAFTTDSELYVVDAEAPRTFHEYVVSRESDAERAAEADTIDLAFSADAHFLAEHRAKRLELADLTTENRSFWVLDSTMNLAPDCSELYVTAAKGWCGAPSAPRDFKWSPRAPWLAYQNEAGALTLGYVWPGAFKLPQSRANPTCDGVCVRGFDFQP